MNQKDGYDNLNPLRGGCCNSSIYKTILQELFHSISASIYFDSAILRKFSLPTYFLFLFCQDRNLIWNVFLKLQVIIFTLSFG